MDTAHPISVVRGPNRRKRRANIGERPAEAIFAEPKLCSLGRFPQIYLSVVKLSVDNLQDAVCKTTALEEPLVNKAYTRGEEKTTGDAVHQTLCHDNLQSLHRMST